MKLQVKYWKYMRRFTVIGGAILVLVKVAMMIVGFLPTF